jgi:heme exporter protein C
MRHESGSRWTAAATPGLVAAAGVAMVGALWAAFLYAPEERVMGAVQRVFYVHLPAALVAFFSTFVLLAGSIGYLWTGRRRWDRLSRAATELAFLFCTLVLTTGPLWAKPAWGTWWTWEAKITTTLVLWLLLAGCLQVRQLASDREQGARLAAVLGILAALDVPVIYKAVSWWRGQHPVVFGPGQGGGLDPRMGTALLVCTITFFLLYAALLAVRMRLAEVEERVADLVERDTA